MSSTDVEGSSPVADPAVCSSMQNNHEFMVPKGEYTHRDSDVSGVREITPEPEPQFERFFFPTVGDEVGTGRTHIRGLTSVGSRNTRSRGGSGLR